MSLLERVYFLHQQLTENRYPNSRTLMEEFEISQPTARRDFAYLRDRLHDLDDLANRLLRSALHAQLSPRGLAETAREVAEALSEEAEAPTGSE